jgi:glucose/arabinose dehydrogenase
MDFDPITGFLWDTENGEDKYDEINLVKPGFNSGWIQVMGPISRNSNKTQEDMVNFPGSKYADPAFSWKYQIGITDIEFLNSSKLGDKYTNNIFVGDINYGNLYYFGINDSRTGIKIDYRLTSSGLNDLVADNNRESSQVIFGTGFGSITDIETGPDGFLYILSYEDGKIYRILPS